MQSIWKHHSETTCLGTQDSINPSISANIINTSIAPILQHDITKAHSPTLGFAFLSAVHINKAHLEVSAPAACIIKDAEALLLSHRRAVLGHAAPPGLQDDPLLGL